MYSVLVADDEITIADTIRSVLNSTIPNLDSLRTFYNGLDVYNYLQTNQADILLLDIEMPVYSGLDIAQLAKERNHDSYIIIITAYRNFEYAQRAINIGVDTFLTKPFSSQQLIDTIRKATTVLEERRTAENRKKAQRSLVQSLLTNDVRPSEGSLNIYDSLRCTEVVIEDDRLLSLHLSELEQLLTQHESCKQHIYVVEYHARSLTLLLLTVDEPNLSLIQDTLKQVTDSSDPFSLLKKSYPSFSRYRLNLSFGKAMQLFTNTLSSGSTYQAKEVLAEYISALDSEQLQAFVSYLHTHYQLLPATADIHGVLDCISTLTIRIMNTNSSNHLVSSVKRYIKEHYHDQDLSLESVATVHSVSSTYLSRIFKRETSRNFSEYLLEIRINQAKILLKTTHYSTDQIASMVGYSSSTYFRHCFKSFCGMTPKQYRQLQHTEKD